MSALLPSAGSLAFVLPETPFALNSMTRLAMHTAEVSTMTSTTLERPKKSDTEFSSPFFNNDEEEDVPSLRGSVISSDSDIEEEDDLSSAKTIKFEFGPAPPRTPLQWEFYGLTLWLELEEFNNDLTNAIKHATHKYGVEKIPASHTTAIYGMTHLSPSEAKTKLQSVKKQIPQWPVFSRPTGIVQDIAVAGRPGQVCSIAWAELTLASNPSHEAALDRLYQIFYGDDFQGREGPWKPHNSIAYDNPEDSVLNLADTVAYCAKHPTLLGMERRVKSISLWDTNGKMGDWKCLDRIHLF